jgi:hypothetical protein
MSRLSSRATVGIPLAAVLLLGASLLVATAASAAPHGASTRAAAGNTTTTTEPPSPWRGPGPPCKIRLPEPNGIVAYGTFYTCPPKRVLIIGDSVALTMGIEMVLDEENWGIVMDDQAILGCGFVTGMEIDYKGTGFGNMSSQCTNEYNTWKLAVESFKPQLVVVELGWWDSQEHLHDGQVVQLGNAWYDTALVGRMIALVKALAVAGSPPIDFLTVPWMDPPLWPGGVTNPAALPAAHDHINALLAEAVRATQPRTRLFDVSPYVTPAGHFELYVDNGQCRETDGVHMYVGVGLDFVLTPCGRALQKGLFTNIREQLQG